MNGSLIGDSDGRAIDRDAQTKSIAGLPTG
jgi:hypothetical protein